MLFSVKSMFENSIPENIKVTKNEKYGIINIDSQEYLLPEEYDNIFIYGKNTFVLYKSGKIGLCRVEENKAEIICDCEYDVIDNYSHNLFLTNETNICYYNPYFNKLQHFENVNIVAPYFYCVDKECKYIIDCATAEVIYKKHRKYGESCFVHCGNTPKGPVFYDCCYSTYLYPTDNDYKCFEYPLNHPLIINNKNIMNIVDGDKGIGIIDSFGNEIIGNNYDEISFELKITAKKKNERIEKVIELPDVYNKNSVSPIEEW